MSLAAGATAISIFALTWLLPAAEGAAPKNCDKELAARDTLRAELRERPTSLARAAAQYRALEILKLKEPGRVRGYLNRRNHPEFYAPCRCAPSENLCPASTLSKLDLSEDWVSDPKGAGFYSHCDLIHYSMQSGMHGWRDLPPACVQAVKSCGLVAYTLAKSAAYMEWKNLENRREQQRRASAQANATYLRCENERRSRRGHARVALPSSPEITDQDSKLAPPPEVTGAKPRTPGQDGDAR